MFKIGQSVDTHKLVEGRPLIIGGIEIPHYKGLLGHSDADVLVHVIIEAIIGALGEGDIGKHFPDTDNAYRNISSLYLLEKIYEMLCQKQYTIGNIDALIMIEKPKMAPYILAMRTNIANVLHCSIEQVNIKATCLEGLGFIGEEKGAQASAVVLIKREHK